MRCAWVEDGTAKPPHVAVAFAVQCDGFAKNVFNFLNKIRAFVQLPARNF